MKKIMLSVLAATAILNSAELPYKIFVETFSSSNNPEISVIADQVKEKIKDFTNAKVVQRKSDNYYVVVVEGIMEKSEAKKLLTTIRSIKGHDDAFLLPAPELLKSNEREASIVKEDSQQITKDQVELKKDEILPVVLPTPQEKTEGIKEIDANSPNAFTLQKMITDILATNPNIRQRVYNYMEVGKELKIANSAYYPTLDLTASYGYYKVKNAATNNEFENGTKANANLTLVQNIYNGNADSSRINQQSSRLDAAAFLVAEKADRTSLEAVRAYLDLIKQKKLLDLAEENSKVHDQIYAQIKDRFDSGFSKASEERQAGSRLTLAQSNLITEQNNYSDSVSTFEKIYGKNIEADKFIWPTFEIPLPQSEAEVMDKALMCNPTIKNQEANIRFANFVKDGTESAYKPKLDLVATADIQKTDIGNNDNRDDTYSAILRLRYNIFNKGADSLEKEKSQIIIQREYQTMDTLKRELVESLKFSWQSYVLSKKKLDYLKEHVEFSKQTLDSYQDEFQIGRRDLINLLDAENEYYNARKEIIKTDYELLLAKYRLLDNMGILADSFEPGFSQKFIKSACSIESVLK